MNNMNFRELCVELYSAAASPLPDFDFDQPRTVSISVAVDGIEVVVRHQPARVPMDTQLSVAFGPLPRENPLAACRVLMDINSLMLWNRECSFARDPATGEIVLQYGYSLRDQAAPDLYASIRELADIANGWRQHSFLCASGDSPIGSLIAAAEGAMTPGTAG